MACGVGPPYLDHDLEALVNQHLDGIGSLNTTRIMVGMVVVVVGKVRGYGGCGSGNSPSGGGGGMKLTGWVGVGWGGGGREGGGMRGGGGSGPGSDNGGVEVEG